MSKDATDAPVRAAAEWLMGDDSAYADALDIAERAAREMLKAAGAARAGEKGSDMPDIEKIANVCHAVNQAICEAVGDHSQKPWTEAEQWQRDSAIKGVLFALENPDATPEQQHQAWCDDKLDAGWVYGLEKDAEAKTHPCLVRYGALPFEQRVKDHAFRAVVAALK